VCIVWCICFYGDAFETSCVCSVVYASLRRCFGNVVCILVYLFYGDVFETSCVCSVVYVFKTMLWKRRVHNVVYLFMVMLSKRRVYVVWLMCLSRCFGTSCV